MIALGSRHTWPSAAEIAWLGQISPADARSLAVCSYIGNGAGHLAIGRWPNPGLPLLTPHRRVKQACRATDLSHMSRRSWSEVDARWLSALVTVGAIVLGLDLLAGLSNASRWWGLASSYRPLLRSRTRFVFGGRVEGRPRGTHCRTLAQPAGVTPEGGRRPRCCCRRRPA